MFKNFGLSGRRSLNAGLSAYLNEPLRGGAFARDASSNLIPYESLRGHGDLFEPVVGTEFHYSRGRGEL
jgi:hypothetical protein